MRFLKGFNEAVGIVNLGSNISQERIPNLQHVGEPIEDGDNISIFQQDWFEKLLPDTIKEDPASAVISPTVDVIESPTTISDVLPFAVIE